MTIPLYATCSAGISNPPKPCPSFAVLHPSFLMKNTFLQKDARVVLSYLTPLSRFCVFENLTFVNLMFLFLLGLGCALVLR